MTLFDWLLLALILVALAVMVYFVAKKWRKLLLLDVEAMPRAKLRSKKYQIIEDRLQRKVGTAKKVTNEAIAPSIKHVFKKFHFFYQKLQALEKKYRRTEVEPETQEGKEKTRNKIVTLLENGAKAFKEENYGDAENLFLDVIRLNPKEVEAYEYLGELYTHKKEYEHAIESLQHALKLRPDEERIHCDLGAVYEAMGNIDKAMEYYQQCICIAPNNPRNLSLVLDCALEKKDRFLAKETLRKLKEADPDNQKLGDLEKKVEQM